MRDWACKSPSTSNAESFSYINHLALSIFAHLELSSTLANVECWCWSWGEPRFGNFSFGIKHHGQGHFPSILDSCNQNSRDNKVEQCSIQKLVCTSLDSQHKDIWIEPSCNLIAVYNDYAMYICFDKSSSKWISSGIIHVKKRLLWASASNIFCKEGFESRR